MQTTSGLSKESIAAFGPLVDQTSMELVFAEPGKDNGLLPLNSLIAQMEDLCTSGAGPIVDGVRVGRELVDGILGSTALFDAPVIEKLKSWIQWLQSSIAGAAGGGAIAPFVLKVMAAESVVAPSTAAGTPEPSQGQGRAIGGPAPAEASLVLNLESDSELLREFTNESQEHLQNIEQGVLTLEEHPTDADTLNSIFRAFHTFKGGSGFLNLTPINRLAHELESLLDLARQHKLSITSQVINVILSGGDVLKRFVGEIDLQVAGQKAPEPILIPTASLLTRIRALIEQRPTAPVPMVEAGGGTAGEGSPESSTSVARNRAASNSYVKVDTQKLDGLVDLVGEMVIAQSLVAQDPGLTTIQSQTLTRNLAQLARITKELQRTAMSLRMVPIRSTFQKMNRLIRDTAAKVGKQVELIVEGEETELDRTIVEEIGDPLIHMIRNSVDHGIEKPETRLALGKPAEGKVWLRAFYQGGNFVIQIADDGAGLNRERILAKATERGLVKVGEPITDKEIFELIFAAGFSTAEKVTDLSGRGVGMDVVRRNIEKLRGKIDIESTQGQGSTFSIYLPLTLAIIEGLIVGIGDQRYILPTLSIRESFRPTPGMVSTLHERGEMVNVRGKLTPLLRLYQHFGVRPRSEDLTQSIMVVVEAGNESRCVLVDQLIGKQEVVIKSLGEAFKRNPALAGAAILGDGRVGLILDPEALVHLRQVTTPVAVAA